MTDRRYPRHRQAMLKECAKREASTDA